MLYERWRQMAQAGGDLVALRDLRRGERWTFKQLAAAAEKGPLEMDALVFPQGAGAEFVFAVLGGWRANRIVCPLEPGQSKPAIAGPLPKGIIHLKTTSATTAAPRLVAFTAEQLAADAENIVRTMGLRAEWPNLGMISLAHSYGFSNLVLPLLLQGIPLILSDSALPETLRQAALSERHLSLPAVPALWRAWHQTHAIPSNVRLAISAGAPLPLELEQEIFARHGLKIHNFYGSTECGGIAYDRSAAPRQEAGCVGEPLVNVSVAIAADGCLEVRSAAVAETYWPEPTPSLGQGIFHTSDLVNIRAGHIYLLGRATDQINVAGRKVSPETIEKALAHHPQVRACLVFGVPGAEPERGEIIVACVATESPLGNELLRQFLLTRLPSWQVPREWWFVESLEANPRGKLSRAEWRARYLESVGKRK